MNSASGLRAGIQQRSARLEIDSFVGPVRVLEAEARDSEPDPGLVQVLDHPELLCRRHAAEALDLDRVHRLVHAAAHLTLIRAEP